MQSAGLDESIYLVSRIFAAVLRRRAAFGVTALVLLVPLVQWVMIVTGPRVVDEPATPDLLETPETDRAISAYEGYGTWIDVYDYAPSFHPSGEPPLTPDDLPEMARLGVRTIYIQAAQLDSRSPGLLVDPAVLSQFLVRARLAGMKVVGWYLPRFEDLDRDLAHLEAISDFEVLGHRFDSVAVDIEWREGVPDHGERSRRLVELSSRLREAVGDDVLGAVVLTPVHLEDVNPNFWPGFPWKELAAHYDVWLPMGYWTDRDPVTELGDGYNFTAENVKRLRDNIGDPDAPVHAIGGIGDEMGPEDVDLFARAMDEVGTIGGSVYDWMTLSPGLREELAGALGEP